MVVTIAPTLVSLTTFTALSASGTPPHAATHPSPYPNPNPNPNLYQVASKPMAQFADDSDRDREKRATERWGDPMLEQLQKEKSKRNPNLPK